MAPSVEVGYVVLAIFNMDKSKVIKVHYFNICDFYDKSVDRLNDRQIDLGLVKKYLSFIPWRFKRSESYVNDIDKLRCILSGILIYKSFGIEEKNILYNKYNKPYFNNPGWNFSISHSGDYVLFVRDSQKIGIDIEKICDKNMDILDYSFNDDEKKFIDDDIIKLTRLWTIKESVFKASGTEEPIEFRDISVVDNAKVSLFNTKYNIISEKIDDYYISIASIEKYDGMSFFKEVL